ncbi:MULTISPECIES: type I-E CRISPR-associated protein Cse2/CasB [Rhodomicrobium]|uniref:type I-E CRISPR-associated protein Cse2/CasB n=1 Tax=Rhodomicrobium TaxID=1068 RepID=UPI000B4B838B|nr:MULTISPECIES: type I-E CRISPR-associated protein Cse2/CasB [Rhodomicrobium]
MRMHVLDNEAEIARAWWSRMQPHHGRDGRSAASRRASIARLRHASSLMKAACEPATADLYDGLACSFPASDLPRVALVAGVLAHIRRDSHLSIAEALGRPHGRLPGPLLSPLRFRRLVAASEPESLLVAFRRVAEMLRGEMNVKDAAGLLMAWTDPRYAETARTAFAFDYHGAGFKLPPAAAALHAEIAEAQ